MFDKRVHRGNSYAAMVIPAGTSHDTMIMEKRQTQKAQSLRQRTFKSTAKVSYTPIRPNNPNLYRLRSASSLSTPTATFLHQSPSQVASTLASKPTSTSRI